MQAVLDLVTPDSAQALKSAQLDLPSATEVLYPDFSMPALHSIPVDDSEPAPAPPFSVDSMPKADWCVGSILAAQSRLDARSDFASRLHAQVDSWLDKASSADLESIIFLMASLRPFAEAEIAKQRRSRSLLLPSGTISLRRSPDQLSIDDPDAAMAWATENAPNALVTRTELSKSTLRTLVLRDNTPVPGVTAAMGSDQLFVRATN